MLSSIFAFGIMVLAMTLPVYRLYKHHVNITTTKRFLRNRDILLVFVVFGLFAAVRWNVGVDCNSYIQEFYNATKDMRQLHLEKGEILWLWIQDFFRIVGLSHVPFFFFLALLQIGLCYYSLKNDIGVLIFLPMMLLFSGDYWMWMNGVRQIIAVCFFMCIIPYMIEKKYIKVLILLSMAILIHHSAIILIPFILLIPFFQRSILPIILQIILIVISYSFLSLPLTEEFLRYAEIYIQLSNYNNNEIKLLDRIYEVTFGLQGHILLICNIVVVLYSYKMKLYFKSKQFKVIYNLYFIGVCLGMICYANSGLTRILLYLTSFLPIIYAYFIFYLYKNTKLPFRRSILTVIITLLLLKTMWSIYNAPSKLDPITKVEYIRYKTIFNHDMPQNY